MNDEKQTSALDSGGQDPGLLTHSKNQTAKEILKGVSKRIILAFKVKYFKTKVHKKVKKNIILTKYEKKIYKSLKNLSRQISKYKTWNAKVRLSIKVARKYVGGPKLVKIVENLANILKVVKERKKGDNETFSVQQKSLALLVMRKSVVAYKFMCRMFYLPPPGKLLTLLKMKPTQKVITYTFPLKVEVKEVCHSLLHSLKKSKYEAEMSEDDLYCSVLFREFDLRLHINSNMKKDYQAMKKNKSSSKSHLADHCLVFMIRSISEPVFKQTSAIVYYKGPANPEHMAYLVKREIRRLDNSSFFIPIATICNEDGCNKEALKYLVHESKKEFEKRGECLDENVFYVDDLDIVPLFDPPQLLISMRNHLSRENLKYTLIKKGEEPNSGTAKWEHIIDFYNFCAEEGRCKYVDKVTKSHVFPKKNEITTLEHVTPIFSHTLAAFIIYSAGPMGTAVIPPECMATGFLLKFFNDLFDTANGCRKESSYHDYNKLITKVKPKSVHHSFWQDALKNLASMTFINKSGEEVKVSTIDNWIWTIEGFQVLVRRIFSNTELNEVWMRSFNMDPLNALFKDYDDDRYLDPKKYGY